MLTTRSDFERLIDLRLQEAKLLLDGQQWDGAYYLCGYAVEYALKIRIISQLIASNAFPERDVATNYFKHDLTGLRRLAKLHDEMDADTVASDWWTVVKDWNEQGRYQVGRSESKARELFEAVSTGILPWINARC